MCTYIFLVFLSHSLHLSTRLMKQNKCLILPTQGMVNKKETLANYFYIILLTDDINPFFLIWCWHFFSSVVRIVTSYVLKKKMGQEKNANRKKLNKKRIKQNKKEKQRKRKKAVMSFAIQYSYTATIATILFQNCFPFAILILQVLLMLVTCCFHLNGLKLLCAYDYYL